MEAEVLNAYRVIYREIFVLSRPLAGTRIRARLCALWRNCADYREIPRHKRASRAISRTFPHGHVQYTCNQCRQQNVRVAVLIAVRRQSRSNVTVTLPSLPSSSPSPSSSPLLPGVRPEGPGGGGAGVCAVDAGSEANLPLHQTQAEPQEGDLLSTSC